VGINGANDVFKNELS